MAIVFTLPSGSPTGPATINNFVAGRTNDPQVIGFFGSAGPGNSISVGSYQDSTYLTDDDGDDRGRGINCKFNSSSTAIVDGANSASLPLSAGSGSMIISLSGIGQSIQTQNARLYAFQMDASSGVQQFTAPDNMTTQMAEINIDSSWTDASTDSANFISFANHTATALQHDFYAAASVKPLTTGTKKSFGFFFSVEYF